MRQEDLEYVPWKRYTFAVSETLITFTIATFLLGLSIMHRGENATLILVPAGFAYVSVVVFSIYRMVRKFSLAANMLMIPIAPLLILGIVVSIIHLLQYFK